METIRVYISDLGMGRCILVRALVHACVKLDHPTNSAFTVSAHVFVYENEDEVRCLLVSVHITITLFLCIVYSRESIFGMSPYYGIVLRPPRCWGRPGHLKPEAKSAERKRGRRNTPRET